jgi:hypothetical protein
VLLQYFCLGGWEGDATFLLKCHALCPICPQNLPCPFCASVYKDYCPMVPYGRLGGGLRRETGQYFGLYFLWYTESQESKDLRRNSFFWKQTPPPPAGGLFIFLYRLDPWIHEPNSLNTKWDVDGRDLILWILWTTLPMVSFSSPRPHTLHVHICLPYIHITKIQQILQAGKKTVIKSPFA